jgi:hypothetical protein
MSGFGRRLRHSHCPALRGSANAVLPLITSMEVAMHPPFRLSLLAGVVASVLHAAIVSAQGTVLIHSVRGSTVYYTGGTTVAYFNTGDPVEHFASDQASPGTLHVVTGKSYRIAMVVAGDLSGQQCILTSTNDQGGFVGPAANDTLDVNVGVDFKWCQYYVEAGTSPTEDDETARGTVHFQADNSWISHTQPSGQPELVHGGAIDFVCSLTREGSLCDRGDDEDKSLAYGVQVHVSFQPDQHSRVVGVSPFGGSIFGAPGEAINLVGAADHTLFFDKVYFASVHVADGSIALTGSSVHDTVVTGTFHVHNAGPDSALFLVYTQGTTVVRAGAGHVAKIEITTPLGTCVQADDPCAILSLTGGASADVTVKTTTARLGDGSSAAVGANSCATMTLVGGADDSHTSDNSVSCVSGTSTPVTVAITTGSAPPTSHTVAVGSTNVPVIQFAMTPANPVTLDDVTLTASGSGSDHIDITAVKLYVDANANGQVDASEAALASGTFAANNGAVTLAVAPPYTVSAPTSFLVTYDFNTTLASRYGGVLVLAGLLPVFFVPRKRRRTIIGALVLVAGLGFASIGLGACGGDSTGPNPPGGSSVTFTATMSGVTASGTAVSGVSVSGATITIAK